MVRRSARISTPEGFAQLQGLGLQIMETKGDGNCLFRALADQVLGDMEAYPEIRGKVIEYMRTHPADFMGFLQVLGPVRRAPKRKTTAAPSGPVEVKEPTISEREQAWKSYLEKMARNREWGSQLEITAFAQAFAMDVKLYTKDGKGDLVTPAGSDTCADRPCVYIAYHGSLHEHYSSIRSVDGPFTGLPMIELKATSHNEEANTEVPCFADDVDKQIQLIKSMVPSYVDDSKVKQAIYDCKGDLDAAYNTLYTEILSTSSGRSSIERELDGDDDQQNSPAKRQKSIEPVTDSDDDEPVGPNRRQNRKIKAAKASRKAKKEETSITKVDTEQPRPSVVEEAPIQSVEIAQPPTEKTTKQPTRKANKIKIIKRQGNSKSPSEVRDLRILKLSPEPHQPSPQPRHPSPQPLHPSSRPRPLRKAKVAIIT